VAGQTLYLFGSSTHEERLFLVPFDSVHSVAQTSKKKHFYTLIIPLIPCDVAVLQLFCKLTKIFLGAQKYHHFEFLIFFKCVAISIIIYISL